MEAQFFILGSKYIAPFFCILLFKILVLLSTNTVTYHWFYLISEKHGWLKLLHFGYSLPAKRLHTFFHSLYFLWCISMLVFVKICSTHQYLWTFALRPIKAYFLVCFSPDICAVFPVDLLKKLCCPPHQVSCWLGDLRCADLPFVVPSFLFVAE